MKNKKCKNKTIILICESKKNSTEKEYFKYLQTNFRDLLNNDLHTFCHSQKFNKNSFFDRLKVINLKDKVNLVIIIRDNDIKNDIFEARIFVNEMILFFQNTAINKLFKKINPTSFLCCGIPDKKINFDYFLLMHFSEVIFKKNNKTPCIYLKKFLGEGYKANPKSIQKIFDSNQDWIENLCINSQWDKNYNNLVQMLFITKKSNQIISNKRV